MFNILVDQIARTLFEPFAVMILCIIIFSFEYWRKSDKNVFIFYCSCIMLAIAWRCGLGIISSRYATLLIFPGIIILGWFCYSSGKLYDFSFINKKYISWFGFCLFVAIICLSVGKLLRVNPYSNHCQKCATALRNDAKSFSHFSWYTDLAEDQRNQYYVGTPYADVINYEGDREANKMDSRLGVTLNRRVLYGYPIYLIFSESTKQPFLTEADLKIPEKSLSVIYWQYQDRRERKRQTVYRFLPFEEPCFKVWDGKKHSYKTLTNGDFELSVQPEDMPDLQKSLAKRGLILPQEVQWPANWTFSMEDGEKNQPQIELSSKAISGEKSLHVVVNQQNGPVKLYSQNYLKAEDGILHFLIKAEKEMEFGVFFHIYDLKKRYIKLHYISYFYLPAGEIFEFHVPVKVSNIPDSDTMLPGFFAQNGEFVLDDIAFIPHNLSIIKNSSTSDYQ